MQRELQMRQQFKASVNQDQLTASEEKMLKIKEETGEAWIDAVKDFHDVSS